MYSTNNLHFRTLARGAGAGRMRRNLDGSDVDISGISLDLPSGLDDDVIEEARNGEDEVLFQR